MKLVLHVFYRRFQKKVRFYNFLILLVLYQFFHAGVGLLRGTYVIYLPID